MTNQRKDSALSDIVNMRNGKWLGAYLDTWVEAEAAKAAADPYKRKRGWFSPSDLSNPCDAYLGFRYLAVPERGKISPRLQRIFDVGNERDEAIKNMIQKAGLSLIDDTGLSYWDRKKARQFELPEWRIRGEYDELVQNPSTGEISIVEIKTMNTDEWQLLKEPKYDHILQGQPYVYAVHEAKNVIYLYENKNTQEWKLFTVNFQQDIWNMITDRLTRIIEQIEQSFVPMRTPAQYESGCRFYWMCAHASIEEYRDAGRS